MRPALPPLQTMQSVPSPLQTLQPILSHVNVFVLHNAKEGRRRNHQLHMDKDCTIFLPFYTFASLPMVLVATTT